MTDDDISDALVHCNFFIGWPRAMAAAMVAAMVAAEVKAQRN